MGWNSAENPKSTDSHRADALSVWRPPAVVCMCLRPTRLRTLLAQWAPVGLPSLLSADVCYTAGNPARPSASARPAHPPPPRRKRKHARAVPAETQRDAPPDVRAAVPCARSCRSEGYDGIYAIHRSAGPPAALGAHAHFSGRPTAKATSASLVRFAAPFRHRDRAPWQPSACLCRSPAWP